MKQRKMQSYERIGAGLVLAAAVLWGTVGPAQVWANSGDDPAALGSARILIGGLALTVLAVRTRASIRPLVRRDVWPWLLLAATATAVYQAGFLFAVSRAGAALATAVALGVAPAATGVFAWVIERDHLSARWAAGTVTAVAGCGLLLLPGASRADAAGIFLGVVAGICYGLYTVAAKHFGARAVNAPAAVAATLLIGGLMISPALIVHVHAMLSPASLALLAWLGLASTAAAYMFFVTGLERVPASTAGTLSLAEPLVAALLGLLVLGERLSRVSTIGMALLLVGLVVVSVPALSRRPAEPMGSGGQSAGTGALVPPAGRP
jgi:drug/metabolite transporter, DME family